MKKNTSGKILAAICALIPEILLLPIVLGTENPFRENFKTEGRILTTAVALIIPITLLFFFKYLLKEEKS